MEPPRGRAVCVLDMCMQGSAVPCANAIIFGLQEFVMMSAVEARDVRVAGEGVRRVGAFTGGHRGRCLFSFFFWQLKGRWGRCGIDWVIGNVGGNGGWL